MRYVLALLLCLTWVGHAHARYNGPVDPEIEAWFKKQKIPGSDGMCCDQSDGEHLPTRITGNHYEVDIGAGTWIAIPPERIILNNTNPTGAPVTWHYAETILCFIDAARG